MALDLTHPGAIWHHAAMSKLVMKRIRAALALSALMAFPTFASAGPIRWSYSDTVSSDGAYSIDPGAISFATAVGQAQDIYLIGGVRFSLLMNPTPIQGPTLWAQVTITDSDSGRSGTFPVPINFTNPVPSLVSGWYQYVPRVGSIAPVDLTLGEHSYLVTNGPDRGLTVQVEGTPEPATIVLVGLGLIGVGLTRLRHRASPKAPGASAD